MSSQSKITTKFSTDFNCKVFAKKLYKNFVKLSTAKNLQPSRLADGSNRLAELDDLTCDPFLSMCKDY